MDISLKDKKKDDSEDKNTDSGMNPVLKQLFDNRTILIFGEIDQKMAQSVISQLLALAAQSDDEITVFINSQGGHVESGDSIHDVLKFIKPKIKIIGTGWVASAGVTIFLSADKDKRMCLPNTRFMIHQPLGGTGGRASEIEIEAQEILKVRERLNKMISDKTGQPIAKVRKDTDRNFWLTAKEAKEYGIVGKIVESSDKVK